MTEKYYNDNEFATTINTRCYCSKKLKNQELYMYLNFLNEDLISSDGTLKLNVDAETVKIDRRW